MGVASLNGNQVDSNAYHDATGSTSTSQSSNATHSTSTTSSSTGSSTSTNSINSTSTTTSTFTHPTSSTSPQTVIYSSSQSSPSSDKLPDGKTSTVSWGTAKGTGSGYDHGKFIGVGNQYSSTKDITSTPLTATDAGKAISDKVNMDLWSTPKDLKTPSGAVFNQDFLKGNDKLANGGTFDHSVNLSAVGYTTNASASLGIEKGSLTAKGNAGVNAYLIDIKAHVGVSDPKLLGGSTATADGHVAVGAGVNASGTAEINLAKGEADCNGDVNCFAGVTADGSEEAKIAGGALGEKATGNVGAGLGFDGKFDVGFKDGKLNFTVGASAYVGVGGGGSVTGEVDPTALCKDAAPVVSDAQKAAGGFMSAANGDVHNVINAFSSWV